MSGARWLSRRQTVLVLGDAVLAAGTAAAAYRLNDAIPGAGEAAAAALPYLLALYLWGLHDFRRDYRRLREFVSLEAAVFCGFALTAVSVALAARFGRMARYPFLPAWGILAAALPAWRFLYSAVAGLRVFDKAALIVGDARGAASVRELLGPRPRGISVIGRVGPPEPSCPEPVPAALLLETAVARGAAMVIVAENAPLDAALVRGLAACAARGIETVDFATLCERVCQRIPFDAVDERWVLRMNASLSSYFLSPLKRAADVAAALCGLILSAPLVPLIALLVRCDSRGPVLYRQERLGLNRRPFTIVKFRTMRPDAEQGTPRWAGENDGRITRVGGFLRRTRLDELPQLVSVLRGEMSFVGPRPEREYFVRRLEDAIPFYGQRFRMKPGLTGWAQVNRAYGASVDDARAKLEYELFYLKNNSPFLDFLICVKTVRTVLFGRGR